MIKLFESNNKLYQNIVKKYNELSFHDMYGLIIPFSSKWKNIGINLSGGADSACLTMLLCNIIKKNNYDCKIHIITHCRCWKTKPWQFPISLKVYNKLKEKWPNIIGKRYKNYIPPEIEQTNAGSPFVDQKGEKQSGDNIVVDSFNRYITYKVNLNATFNATTLNPSNKEFITKLGSIGVLEPPKRSKTAENGLEENVIWKYYSHYECTPFVFIEKNVIMAFYDLYENLDLLNITRSCEGEIDQFDINKKVKSWENYSKNENMEVPLCGECYWCVEREWSILNKDKCIDIMKNT